MRFISFFTHADDDSHSQKLVFLHPTPYGALTQLFAGTMPEALDYNGEVGFVSRRSFEVFDLTDSLIMSSSSFHSLVLASADLKHTTMNSENGCGRGWRTRFMLTRLIDMLVQRYSSVVDIVLPADCRSS